MGASLLLYFLRTHIRNWRHMHRKIDQSHPIAKESGRTFSYEKVNRKLSHCLILFLRKQTHPEFTVVKFATHRTSPNAMTFLTRKNWAYAVNKRIR